MVRRLLRAVTAGGIVAGSVLMFGTPTAHAQSTLGCTTVFDGRNTDRAIAANQAFHVTKDQVVQVAAQSVNALDAYSIQLNYGLLNWTVASGKINPPDTEWGRQIRINQYARYGVGLYRVTAFGHPVDALTSCGSQFYIKVEGPPLEAVAVQAAAAGEVVGAILVVGSALTGATEEQKKLDEKYQEDLKKQAEAQANLPEEIRKKDAAAGNWILEQMFCNYRNAAKAIILTAAVMAERRGGPGTVAATAALPLPTGRRVPWIWRTAPVAIAGGLLMGVTTTVLLQQYSLLYPTGGSMIALIGAGVALGVLGPSFTITRARRRWLANLPEAEQQRLLGAVGVPADIGWAPTHSVPADGLATYPDHDASLTPGDPLVGALDVQVVEWWGDWAKVRCENTWECWVDGRALVAR